MMDDNRELSMEDYLRYGDYSGKDEDYCEDACSQIGHKTGELRKKRRNTKRERYLIHKDKMIRRFFKGMLRFDLKETNGMRCPRADVLAGVERGCPINQYTKTFISPRGDIRKYQGQIKLRGRYYFELCGHEHDYYKKLVESRIRRERLNEESSISYSYLKKKHAGIKHYCW